MWDIGEETMMNLGVISFSRPWLMDVPVLVDQQEFIYISSLRTQDEIWKTVQ